jgi:hypothetical protein
MRLGKSGSLVGLHREYMYLMRYMDEAALRPCDVQPLWLYIGHAGAACQFNTATENNTEMGL